MKKIKTKRLRFRLSLPILLVLVFCIAVVVISVILQNNKNSYKSRAEELESPEESSLNIIGGHDADPAKWPFVAKITIDRSKITGVPSNTAPWCSGSLINEQWMASAAHCFISNGKRISLDAIKVSFTQDDNRTSYGIVSLRFHDTNLAAIKMQGSSLPDIVLIKLDQKVPFIPVDIPSEDFAPPANSNLFAAGWGAVKLTSSGLWITEIEYPNKLQEIVLENRMNISKQKEVKFTASSNDGSICGGDSGGPLVFRDSASPKTYLIGIHSAGSGCGRGAFSFHTNVVKYANWISAMINPTNETPENAQTNR